MIEALLNALGGALALVALAVAVPLVAGGFWLRRGGRRRLASLRAAHGHPRTTRDLQPGEVLLRGTLRVTHEGELVEDGQGRVRLVRADGAPAIADGATVVVRGAAVKEEPESMSYRGAARRWVIDTRTGWVSSRPDVLLHANRTARLRVLAGGLLFAVGVALAAGGAALSWHAHDLVAYDFSE
jgi:hypothetical protein